MYVTASHVYQPYKYTRNYNVSSVKLWYLPWNKTATKFCLSKKLQAFHFGPRFLISQSYPASHTNHRIIEWVGTDLNEHLVPSACHGQGHLPRDQAAQGLARPDVNTATAGAPTTSLGNLVHYLTPPTANNFFLISSLNSCSFSFYPLLPALSLQLLMSSPSPVSL